MNQTGLTIASTATAASTAANASIGVAGGKSVAGMSAAGKTAGGDATWRVVLSVFKLRIAVLIMLTAIGGMAIVPGGSLSAVQGLVLALSVFLASASAGAFNQFVEADTDRLMKRTRNRAFANGTLPRSAGWLLAIVALQVLAVAAAAWWVNGLAAFFVLMGALTYALVYTLWLKRRTPWNIVIGGLAGSFAVLAGAAAVIPQAGPQIGPLALLLALVLFLWTPPHFWSLAIANTAEYEAAGVPMLPVVVGTERAARFVHAHTVLLVAVSLLPLAFGAGWVYGLCALLGGAHFLRRSHALMQKPQRSTAMASFFASMVQLSALLGGVLLDALLR